MTTTNGSLAPVNLAGLGPDETLQRTLIAQAARNAITPTFATDASGNVTGLVGPSGGLVSLGGSSAPLDMSRPLRVAFAGDSIASLWAGRDGWSPLWWAASELYPCFYTTAIDTSLGGTSSSHLLTNQIAPLEALATKPDVVIVQTFQNDFIGTTANADSFLANFTTYSARALAAGVKLVVAC